MLLVSISAASVLVWNATRDQKPKQAEEDKISPKKMQGSSKMKTVITADIIETMETDYIVTDEEVKRTRDMMLSTSKSGRVMSDDKIREMLEEQKKEELKHKTQKNLIPSSKSMDPILTPIDIKDFIEGNDVEKKAPLMHSSKAPLGPLIDQKDLENIIEGKKQDSNDLQKLPPQEEKK